jgi:hypothetical protein
VLKASTKGSLASKLTPAWLFNPFRTTASEPQTSQVSASAVSSRPHHPSAPSTATTTMQAKPPPAKALTNVISQSPSPMTIRKPTSSMGRSSNLSRTFEEETHFGYRSSVSRRSPMNTPPRDEGLAFKRRSFPAAHPGVSVSSSSPGSSTNPTRTRSHVSRHMRRVWSCLASHFALAIYGHRSSAIRTVSAPVLQTVLTQISHVRDAHTCPKKCDNGEFNDTDLGY